jgi:hypothetical protein
LGAQEGVRGSSAELYRRESKSQTLSKMEIRSEYQSWLTSMLMDLLFPLALFLKDFIAISGTLGWRESLMTLPSLLTHH